MNHKKWITVWLISIILIPLIALLNYIIDPYGMNNLLSIDNVNQNKKTNTKLTIRFKSNILEKGHFQTIMLGTSRIGVMDPNIVDEILDTKTFNLEIPGSTTEVQHKMFMYALHFNKIKNLIYGIDFMAFNASRTIQNNFTSFYKLQKNVETNKSITNYDLYFNVDTTQDSVKILYKNIKKNHFIEECYLPSNGMRDYQNHIDALKNNVFDMKKSIQASMEMYFNKESGIYKNYKFSKKYLKYFKKTLDYCKKNNIKVWVYIPPIYKKHFYKLQNRYSSEFKIFQNELSQITPYIDFTGYNSLTNNIENFWDTSHLRKELTPTLMNKVLNNKDLKPNITQ